MPIMTAKIDLFACAASLEPSLSEGHEHASAYEALKAQFTEEERFKLTLTINIINGWNRIVVCFGFFAGAAPIRSAAQAAA
jgi:alkylhydroperoxidase family enzyme